ncbi:MAG TPA: hypothetical protein VIB98_07025 [Gemmatimonadaceae bacterium]
MSTHTLGRALALSASVLGLLACSHPVSQKLSDLCGGYSVVQHVVLVVDTLTPRAGTDAQRLVGKRYPITINLNNLLNPRNCDDRSGEGAVLGYIPDALKTAVTSRKQVMRWDVEGKLLRVDLNPGVIDNNLNFALPLDGTDGHWSLSTLAGQLGWGRLLIDSTAGR